MALVLNTVLAYHRRTKHHLRSYAAGPGGMDWRNQPNPFRFFDGSPLCELPLLAGTERPRYVDLYRPGAIAPQALTLEHVAGLLELAVGLSAAKQHGGNRWFLRCNPSSGNLHPTEAYAVIAGLPGIEDGVHHYVSRDHVLEGRCRFDKTPVEHLDSSFRRKPESREFINTLDSGLRRNDDEILNRSSSNVSKSIFPSDSFLVGLTSIHWREAWKYGERAYRYCQHDAGHAIAAVRYAAAVLGWRARLLTSWGDADVGAILGLDRDADFGDAEREHPDAVLRVTAGNSRPANADFSPDACVRAATDGQWHGQANVLSVQHGHDWPVIDEVAQACIKPSTPETFWSAPTLPEPIESACTLSAVEIIKQRRSALAFDEVTSITTNAFYRMLDMTLPRPNVPPWDAIGWQPRVHLTLFVHRVDSLEPGLYLFLRNAHAETKLRAELTSDFEWARVPHCPTHLLLFRLATGDARNAARTLSCHQDIAADGAFSLGMLAEYETHLTKAPWAYRELFWETGILGQVLYLESESALARATGIGCYFDDAVHKLLGLKSEAFQSLYHFTTGGALTDTRLQALPAYAHLRRTRSSM